jgi:hypothetical protein
LCKVFLGAQLILALGVAVAALAIRGRGAPWARALRGMAPATLVALAALPGVLALARGSGGEQVHVVLAPLHMIRDSLANLRFENIGFSTLALAALPWLVLSLGLRLVGLVPAARAALSGPTAAVAVAGLALSGWPLGLLFHAAARDIDGRDLPSAAIYFVEQSGAVLWVFAAIALAASRHRRRRVLVLALAAASVLPATVEFAVRKAQVAADPVPAPWVRAVAAIAREARPGERVLQRPSARFPPLPVVLASQRVLYERFTPYLTQFAPADELRRRHEALYRFFRTSDREEAAAIARSLDTRYLCLYGSDRIHFDPRGVLTPLHEEEGARSYRFEWLPDDGAGPPASQPGPVSGEIR